MNAVRRLRALCARLATSDTMRRIVDPVLSDLATELSARSGAARLRRAMVVWMPHLLGLGAALTIHTAERACEFAFDWKSEDHRQARRTLAWTLALGLLFTAVMCARPLLDFADVLRREHVSPWPLVPYLVPQAVGIALPFAVAAGLVVGLGSSRPARRVCVFAWGICLAMCLVTFVTVDRIVPVSNQAFREAMLVRVNPDAAASGVPLARGPGEMSLSEVAQWLKLDHGLDSENQAKWRQAYYGRLGLCLSPASLGLFMMTLVTRRSIRRVAGIAIGLAAPFAFWGLLICASAIGETVHAPSTVAWAPNALCVLLALSLRGLVIRADERPLAQR